MNMIKKHNDGKDPRSKIQAPEKLQNPSSNLVDDPGGNDGARNAGNAAAGPPDTRPRPCCCGQAAALQEKSVERTEVANTGMEGWRTGRLGRKPRCDSPLRRLPAEAQAQIMERLETSTLEEVRRALGEAGVAVTVKTLSKFRRWYLGRVESEVGRVREMVDNVAALKEVAGDGMMAEMTEEKMFRFVQQALCVKAFKEKDNEGFARLFRLWLERRKGALEARKLQAYEIRNPTAGAEKPESQGAIFK